jgi:hypothetical protein
MQALQERLADDMLERNDAALVAEIAPAAAQGAGAHFLWPTRSWNLGCN